MSDIEKHIQRLIRQEGLDNFRRLLTPRELDEVPLVSRLARLHFLSGMDVHEKSRVLVVSAVKYLSRILAFVESTRRSDVVVMVSVLDWEDLRAPEPDPLRPNFWISTHPERDLVRFRLRPGASAEAAQVIDWLRSADLLLEHGVFDSADPVTDPDLRRVYVARLDSWIANHLVVHG